MAKWKAVILEVSEEDMAFIYEAISNISGPPEAWKKAAYIMRMIDEAPRQEYEDK